MTWFADHMRGRQKTYPYKLLWLIALCLLVFLLVACNAGAAPAPATTVTNPPAATIEGLTAEQAATLSSLALVDPYPLYTMDYLGDYETAGAVSQPPQPGRAVLSGDQAENWACSLFAALAGGKDKLYGRNFDWRYSPALLLFTDPSNGYASVSMVDITYLGFNGERADEVAELPLSGRTSLLRAPFWPFDGLNEHGLAVGMAAVPPGDMAPDPDKESISSLGIIRQLLDHARDVDEAVAMMVDYNIDMGGGPPLHYLLADAKGGSALVEFYQGEMRVLPADRSWQQATNFLRSAAGESAEGHCWRYDAIEARLTESDGTLDPAGAMELLSEVAQANTQWSVVYDLGEGQIQVAMGGEYDDVYDDRLVAGQ